MKCLGIECTAHTFGASVVDEKGRVLSNEKASFTSGGKGMIPREVARFHEANRGAVLEKALEGHKIGLVAVSQGPGIGSMLFPGMAFAKKIAEKFDAPLMGVNHAVAHFEIGILKCNAKDPVFLYVSGGNTQILVREKKRYRVVGETLDIGIGNLLDKSARHLGLGFPGGPFLYELSLKGNNYVELPYNVKGMDVCFSGLYTDFTRKCETHKSEDMAFSLQETAFDMVLETAERALAHFEKDELLLAGGVACSKILQHKAKVMCEERGAKMLVPENGYLTDNGAMIAWNGLIAYRNGTPPLDKDSEPKAHWRADNVDVTW